MLIKNKFGHDSVKQRYRVRFRRRPETRLIAILFYSYVVIALCYMAWRLSGTVNWTIWYGPLLLGADIYGIVTTGLFLYIVRNIYDPVHHHPSRKYTVDALIPTYNEPANIVGPTIERANKVRGIGKVIVLDDGNRPAMRELCKRLGATYHASVNNSHAKAGNLNQGLKLSDAEILLLLDCDHIPQANFLDRTLGYFDDLEVGIVQTPQTYYNRKSFLYREKGGGRQWSEQGMFYECIQPAKNHYNSAFFVGTSALLRRRAIDGIGGFATGTATEDIHSSLRLHADGWKSVFVDEPLAFGLEAASFKEFYKQRLRWAAGSLGLLLRSKDSPLAISGLSFRQRLNYLSATLAHLQGVQRLLYILIPVFCIIQLQSPVHMNIAGFCLIYIPFMLVSIVMTAIAARGSYHLFFTECFGLASIFTHLMALKGVIRIQKKFEVSRKSVISSEKSWVKIGLYGLLLIFFMVLVRAVLLLNSDVYEPVHELVLISSVFVVINFSILAGFLIQLTRYEHQRTSLTGSVSRDESIQKSLKTQTKW